jgi:hypothetical protein
MATGLLTWRAVTRSMCGTDRHGSFDRGSCIQKVGMLISAGRCDV